MRYQRHAHARQPSQAILAGDMRRQVGLAIAAVLFAIGIAQGADLITFLRLMIEHGPGAEANPLVRAGVAQLGVLPLIAAKAALVALVGAAFAIVVRTRPRVGLLIATSATAAGLVGAFSNVLSL
jgi:hypothetical protein